MEVVVYDKDNCGECRKTEKLLDELGVSYETKNVSHDPDALAYIKELGFTQAPVVIVGEEKWSGHQPQKINALFGSVGDDDEDDDAWDF